MRAVRLLIEEGLGVIGMLAHEGLFDQPDPGTDRVSSIGAALQRFTEICDSGFHSPKPSSVLDNSIVQATSEAKTANRGSADKSHNSRRNVLRQPGSRRS